jgi:transposase
VAGVVADILAANPFTTLDNIVRALRQRGVGVSRATACRAVRSAGWTRKRSRYRVAGKEPTPEDGARYLEDTATAATGEVISLDETCVYLEDSPRFGYSLKGQRCTHRRRNAARRTGKVSLLLAISNVRGVVAHTVVNGSFRASSFADFLRRLPAAGEQPTPVILDNVAFHKSAVARAAASEAGLRLVFIPPYSPDFNPVENAFSVLKQALRSGRGVSDALRTLTTDKCAAFFRRSQRHAEMIRDAEGEAQGR